MFARVKILPSADQIQSIDGLGSQGMKLASLDSMDGAFRFTSKPYEIRQRVRQFVVAVISVYPENPTWNRPSAQAWEQLFKAASSSGAHLEEADAGSTRRHFKSLCEGALREMREAKYWLIVISAGQLEGWRTLGQLPDEASQLVAILTAIVANTGENDENDTRR